MEAEPLSWPFCRMPDNYPGQWQPAAEGEAVMASFAEKRVAVATAAAVPVVLAAAE